VTPASAARAGQDPAGHPAHAADRRVQLAEALGTGPLLVKPDEDGGTVDILPRLKAGDSTYYADWSIR
jgi:hypothetical protein